MPEKVQVSECFDAMTVLIELEARERERDGS